MNFRFLIKKHNNKDEIPDSAEPNHPASPSGGNTFSYAKADIKADIAELEKGHENRLAVLYCALLSRDAVSADKAANTIHSYMESLDVPKLIRLSRQFREYTSMEWSIDWKHISLSDIRTSVSDWNAFLNILRLGTFHPNGYFREKCMWALKDDEASLPFIALRLNDWVKPVRDSAYLILSEKLADAKTDTAIEMLPFISQAKKGERYACEQLLDIERQLSEKILLHLNEISLDRIRDYLPTTKRFLYKILICPDVLSKDAVNRLLQREKSGNEKALIISRILKHYVCSDEELELYIRSKSPIVRKRALEVKYEHSGGPWNGLEEHLLDKARGIRSDVCYILRKHTDFDILSYYKSRLHTPDEAVAILGIGENGTEKDAALLMEYLYAASEKLVKYAMKSLSSLGATGLDAVYWDYLNDTNVAFSKAAYDAVCKSDILFGAQKLYDALQNSQNCHTRKYLLHLLVKEPSWERLPYLLLLYKPESSLSNPDDKKAQMTVRRALSFRNVYAKVTEKQAAFIINIMDMPQLEIPVELKKAIRFDLEHIGRG